MKLPSTIAYVALVALSLLGAPCHAAEPRHGVITSLQPIENRGDDESDQLKENRRKGIMAGAGAQLGLLLGSMKSNRNLGTAGVAASAAAPQIGAKVAEKVGGPGPTTRFMVKVKLDNRKVLSITQLRQELGELKEGDRVIVTGTGDDAKVGKE